MAKDILEKTCNNEDCPTWTYAADTSVNGLIHWWLIKVFIEVNILQLPPAVIPVLNAGEILPTTLNNNVYDEVHPTSPSPYPVDRRTEGRKTSSHIPMQNTR